jgi:DNA polymerase III gamma/tau subunit
MTKKLEELFQLPTEDIIKFLRNISNSENLNMNDNTLLCIQKIYKSDNKIFIIR